MSTAHPLDRRFPDGRDEPSPPLNQIVCALRYFYGVTLGRETIPERIPYAREPHRPPVVLSADEVARFLEAVARLGSRAALLRGRRAERSFWAD